MTEKEFERAIYLDNQIKHLKNIKRNFELSEFDNNKITGVTLYTNYGIDLFLNKETVNDLLLSTDLLDKIKIYVDQKIPFLELEFNTLIKK